MELFFKKILFVIVLSIVFSSNVFAGEVNTFVSDNTNLYEYNALENRVSFRDTGDSNFDKLDMKLFQDEKIQIDVIKELQNITKKQEISLERIRVNTIALKNRNIIGTFFIGNNLGTLKFQLVQIEDQIYLLNALALKTEDNVIKIKIENQAKLLGEEQAKVENFIFEKDNKFSLFGWLVTAF